MLLSCADPPGAAHTFLSNHGRLQVEDREDGAEEAVDEAAGVGDLVSAVADLADDDLDVNDDAELGNDGEGELDDGAGDDDDQVEAGLELDADDSEDFGIELNEGLEANLNLGNESLDADHEVKDDLELSGNEDVGIDEEAIELRGAALEDVQVNLQVDEGGKEDLGVDVNIGHNASDDLEVSLDLGLDIDDGLDNGVDNHDNVGTDADDIATGRREVLDGGLDAAGAAGAGDINVGNVDAGLVSAAAGARSCAGLQDGGGDGRANGEGGESGAEELHVDGWRIKR